MATEPKLFDEAKNFWSQQKKPPRPLYSKVENTDPQTPPPGASATDDRVQERKFERKVVQVRRTNSMFSESHSFWAEEEKKKRKPPAPLSKPGSETLEPTPSIPTSTPAAQPTSGTPSTPSPAPTPQPTTPASPTEPKRESVAELKARLAAKRAERAALVAGTASPAGTPPTPHKPLDSSKSTTPAKPATTPEQPSTPVTQSPAESPVSRPPSILSQSSPAHHHVRQKRQLREFGKSTPALSESSESPANEQPTQTESPVSEPPADQPPVKQESPVKPPIKDPEVPPKESPVKPPIVPALALKTSTDETRPAVPPISPSHTGPLSPDRDEIQRRISERLERIRSPRAVPSTTPREISSPTTELSPRSEQNDPDKAQEIRRRIAERKFNEEMRRQAREAAERRAAEEAEREAGLAASKAALEKAITEARVKASQAALAAARKKAAERAAELARKKQEEEEKKRIEEEAKRRAEEEEAKRKAEEEEAKKLVEEANKFAAVNEASNEEIDLDKTIEDIEHNSIKQVNLRMEGLEDDQVCSILEPLITNTSVEFLNLDGNELSEPSFQLLNRLLLENATLKFLSLNFVQLGDEGSRNIIQGLQKNKTIKEFAISGNDLFDRGMAMVETGLSTNSSIQVLVLSENSIMDSGCKYLSSLMKVNTTLTYLDLSNNYIEAEGAHFIAEFLTQNTTVRHLNLQRNSIQNSGCIALAKALASPESALQVLDISNNIIETDGILALCEALRTNKSLQQVILRQNILEIKSETVLQEILVSKERKLDLQWRNSRTTNDPPLTALEIESIISYFGATTIIKWYAERISLEPLADIENLLCSIVWTQEDAVTLFKWTFDLATNNYDLMRCFNKIMKKQIDNHTTDFWLAKLVAGNEDILRNYLAPPLNRLGVQQSLLFQTFAILTTTEEDLICHVAETSDILKYGTQAFFDPAFKNHSVFQSVYSDFFIQILSGERPLYYFLLSKLIMELDFLGTLIRHFLEELDLPLARRSSRFGYLFLLIRTFDHLSPDVKERIRTIISMIHDVDTQTPLIEKWQAVLSPDGPYRRIQQHQSVPEEDLNLQFAQNQNGLVADEVVGSQDSTSKKFTPVSSI